MFIREGEIRQLLAIKKAPGKPAKITGKVRERFKEKLQEPTGFRRDIEVQNCLEKTESVKAAYQTVHQTVRYKLEAKLKTPRPSNLNKNERGKEQLKKLKQASKAGFNLFSWGDQFRYFCQNEIALS